MLTIYLPGSSVCDLCQKGHSSKSGSSACDLLDLTFTVSLKRGDLDSEIQIQNLSNLVGTVIMDVAQVPLNSISIKCEGDTYPLNVSVTISMNLSWSKSVCENLPWGSMSNLNSKLKDNGFKSQIAIDPSGSEICANFSSLSPQSDNTLAILLASLFAALLVVVLGLYILYFQVWTWRKPSGKTQEYSTRLRPEGPEYTVNALLVSLTRPVLSEPDPQPRTQHMVSAFTQSNPQLTCRSQEPPPLQAEEYRMTRGLHFMAWSTPLSTANVVNE
jgi:hypothetical protein